MIVFFVASAVFGEVQLSLFVAGVVLREMWNDNRSAKCFILDYEMFVVNAKLILVVRRVAE